MVGCRTTEEIGQCDIRGFILLMICSGCLNWMRLSASLCVMTSLFRTALETGAPARGGEVAVAATTPFPLATLLARQQRRNSIRWR